MSGRNLSGSGTETSPREAEESRRECESSVTSKGRQSVGETPPSSAPSAHGLTNAGETAPARTKDSESSPRKCEERKLGSSTTREKGHMYPKVSEDEGKDELALPKRSNSSSSPSSSPREIKEEGSIAPHAKDVTSHHIQDKTAISPRDRSSSPTSSVREGTKQLEGENEELEEDNAPRRGNEDAKTKGSSSCSSQERKQDIEENNDHTLEKKLSSKLNLVEDVDDVLSTISGETGDELASLGNGIRFSAQVVLPGFKRRLPDYASGSREWEKQLHHDHELLKAGAIGEFYCSAAQIGNQLKTLLKPNECILELGCGLSPLCGWIAQQKRSLDLMLGVDFCKFAIQQARIKYRNFYPLLQFGMLDVQNLRPGLLELCKTNDDIIIKHSMVQNFVFDVVLDKGTIDCLFCDGQNVAIIRKYLGDIYWLLKPGGCFVLVSAAVPETRLYFFTEDRWKVEHSLIEDTGCYLYMCTSKRGSDEQGAG